MNFNKYPKEIFLYIAAGFITTVINFIVYYILIFFQIDYKISNTFAFVVSIIIAFIVNKKYVFESRKKFSGEFYRFSGGRVLTYLLDIGSIVLLVDYLKVNEYTAKIWTNLIVIAINYFISKYWIFK